MCQCTPEIRTPYCGVGDCVWPERVPKLIPSHQLMQYFSYEHLPPRLQEVSKYFYYLACEMDTKLDDNPEKDEFFRKLLEAKDCAVRSTIWKEPPSEC